MKVYLKHIIDLETSLYKQIEVYKTAKKNLVLQKPVLDYPDKPKYEADKLEKPKEPIAIKADASRDEYNRTGGVAGLFFMIFFGVIGIVCLLRDNFLISFLGSISCVIATAMGYMGWQFFSSYFNEKKSIELSKAEYPQKVALYEKELEEYNAKMSDLKEKYIAEENEFKEVKRKAEEEYTKKLEIAKSNYEIGKNTIAQLKTSSGQTKDALGKLYSSDIIFPKYRNLIAMCTIYEYFASGRVSELEGPNGAYNLYESELRQNLIINNLDKISNQLDLIKDNQYTLYKAIGQTNKILGKISKEVTQISKTAELISEDVHSIAKTSYISACYSKAIAENTEALKYIALING